MQVRTRSIEIAAASCLKLGRALEVSRVKGEEDTVEEGHSTANI